MNRSTNKTNTPNKTKNQEKFLQKNKILERYFHELNPINYLSEIFNNLEVNYFIPKLSRPERGDIYDILDSAWYEGGIYVSYQDFDGREFRRENLKAIRCLIADIDDIDSRDIYEIIQLIDSDLLSPTYLVNSGNGIHLIFKLKRAISYSESIENLNRKFLETIKEKLPTTDILPLTHYYRVPGSYTKFGEKATVFRAGDEIELREIRMIKNYEKIMKNRIYSEPNAHPMFYYWFRSKILETAIKGCRYTSLYALSIVAWKCKISKKQLEKDLKHIVSAWNKKFYYDPLKENEIKKALKAYKPISVSARREYLNTLVNFEMKPKHEKTLREHLKRISRKKKDRNRKKLQYWLKKLENPSITELMNKTEMDYKTIKKYLKSWKIEL